MFLNIGNHIRIDDPTPKQIGFHLRQLSSGSSFVILEADADHFLQAILEHDAVRVEWRQEQSHRFAVVSLAIAEQMLHAFHRWDETTLSAFTWRRLTLTGDPYRRNGIAAVVMLVTAAIGLIYFLWRQIHARVGMS